MHLASPGRPRAGSAPTITLGPYPGDIATVDHIISLSICMELDNRIYNLEFMPGRMNSGKGATITDRQVQLARKWHEAGLLSQGGLEEVEAEVTKQRKAATPSEEIAA